MAEVCVLKYTNCSTVRRETAASHRSYRPPSINVRVVSLGYLRCTVSHEEFLLVKFLCFCSDEGLHRLSVRRRKEARNSVERENFGPLFAISIVNGETLFQKTEIKKFHSSLNLNGS